jgi:hypothetical protein
MAILAYYESLTVGALAKKVWSANTYLSSIMDVVSECDTALTQALWRLHFFFADVCITS